MSNKIYKIIVENFSTGQENLLYKDNNIYKINNFISNKYIVHSYNLLQYILNTQNPNIVINNSNNWFFDSNNSLIKSNDISNNQNTFLQFTLKKEFFNNIIDYSELNLKINFKVSSELNYDNFFIYINNQIINIESGEVTKTIDYNFTDVNNDLEIKFKYEKDSSVSVGEDGVTILDIKLNVLKEQQFQIYPKEIIKLNNEPINATGVQDLLLLIDDNINQKINTTSKYKLYFKLKYYSLYLIEETNINFVTKTTEEKKLFNITGSTLDYITYLTPWIMDINNLQALKITNSDKNIKMQIEDIYLIIGTENIEEKITDSIEEYINILESGNGSGNGSGSETGSGSNGSETGKNTVEYALNLNKIIGNPYFNDKWKKQFYIYDLPQNVNFNKVKKVKLYIKKFPKASPVESKYVKFRNPRIELLDDFYTKLLKDANIYKMEIYSSKGTVLNSILTTNLNVKIYRGQEDVTSLINSNRLFWKRISPYDELKIEDKNWSNEINNLINRTNIEVHGSDIVKNTQFICELHETSDINSPIITQGIIYLDKIENEESIRIESNINLGNNQFYNNTQQTFSPSWKSDNLIINNSIVSNVNGLLTNVTSTWYYKFNINNEYKNINEIQNDLSDCFKSDKINFGEIIEYNATNLKIKQNILQDNIKTLYIKYEVVYNNKTYIKELVFNRIDIDLVALNYDIKLSRENTVFQVDGLGNNIKLINNDTDVKVYYAGNEINDFIIEIYDLKNCNAVINNDLKKVIINQVTNDADYGYVKIGIKLNDENHTLISVKAFNFNVIKIGLPNAPGAKGTHLNLKGLWQEGVNYVNDAYNGTDLVYYGTKRYYCLQNHISDNTNKPIKGGNAFWAEYKEIGGEGTYVYLKLSDSVIKKEKSGLLTPSTITASSYIKKGTSAPEPLECKYKLFYYKQDTQQWYQYLLPQSIGTTINFNLPNVTFKYLKLELYDKDEIYKHDEQIIPIVEDGSDNYTFVLDNDNITLPSNYFGNIYDYSNLSTNIIGYKGATKMKYGGYKKAIIYETEQTFENDLTVFNEKDYNLIEKNKYELDGIGFGVYLNNLVSVKMNKVYIITTGIYVNKDTTLNYLNLNLKGQVKIFVNNMLQNLYNEIDTGGGFKEQNYILNLRQGLNDLKIIFKGENITINKSSFNHIDVRKIDGYKDLGFNVILDNGRDDIFTLQETENKDINLSIKSGVNIETLNNYFTNNSGKIKIICYPIDNNGIGKEITWNKSKDGRETIGVMITGPQVFVQNINGNGYEPESITLKLEGASLLKGTKHYRWSFKRGTTDYIEIPNNDSNTLVLTHNDTNIWNNIYNSITIKCEVWSENDITDIYSDYKTIVKLNHGSGYTVVLTNEAHVINCNAAGQPVENEIGNKDSKSWCEILSFKGTQKQNVKVKFLEQINCVAMFNKTIESDGYAHSNRNDVIGFYLYNVTGDSGSVKLEIVFEDGVVVNKVMTWAKAKDGIDGLRYITKGMWREGETYVNNENSVDLVIYDGSVFACKQTHVASLSNRPLSYEEIQNNFVDENAFWKLFMIRSELPPDLDWVREWAEDKVNINGDKVLAGKIFAGTKNENGYSGIAIGKNINGLHNEDIGLAGYNNSNRTFYFTTDGRAVFGTVPGRQLIVNADGTLITPTISTNEVIVTSQGLTYQQEKDIYTILNCKNNNNITLDFYDLKTDFYSVQGKGFDFLNIKNINITSNGAESKSISTVYNNNEAALKYTMPLLKQTNANYYIMHNISIKNECNYNHFGYIYSVSLTNNIYLSLMFDYSNLKFFYIINNNINNKYYIPNVITYSKQYTMFTELRYNTTNNTIILGTIIYDKNAQNIFFNNLSNNLYKLNNTSDATLTISSLPMLVNNNNIKFILINNVQYVINNLSLMSNNNIMSEPQLTTLIVEYSNLSNIPEKNYSNITIPDIII